jgi:hypothetical protein
VAFRDQVTKCLPLQQFHGNECLAIGFIDLIDGADVRVIKRRGSLGFALKAIKGLRVFCDIIWHPKTKCRTELSAAR